MTEFTLEVHNIEADKEPSKSVVKGYYLTCADCRDGWIFSLTNQDGEGMSISEKNLFDMFDKEFKENF